MKRFIFGEKNGIYVIDLEKTADCISKACEFLRQTVENGGDVLFVGTKPQAQEIIRDVATRCGMYYVNARWLGGLLTNFQTIRKSVKRYLDLNKMKADGTFEKLTKKEAASLTKEMTKFEKTFSGVCEMSRLPAALIVIDATHELIAVKEAFRLNIPVVALVDTNANPDLVAYPIPANDDAIRSIRLIMNILMESLLEGRASRKAPSEKGALQEGGETVAAVPETSEGKKETV